MNGVLLGVALLAAAPLAEPPAGSSSLGTRGLLHVESAELLPAGVVTVRLGGGYFRARDLLVLGDQHSLQRQEVTVAFSPIPKLELALGWARSVSSNTAFTRGAGHAGDPRVTAKLGMSPLGPVALALGASLLVPTSWGGRGLALTAPALTLFAAGSYDPAPRWRTAVELGLCLDRTGVAAPFGASALQRFDAGVGVGDASRLRVGLGAERVLTLFEGVYLAPFVELSAQLRATGPFGNNPVLASGGVKLFALRELVEVRLSGDLRVSGAPAPSSAFAGLPPWSVGLALASRFSLYEPPPSGAAEVPTFVLVGRIVNGESGSTVAGALVRVGGYTTALAADEHGQFKSWPIPVGDAILELEVEASGFRVARERLGRGRPGQVLELVLDLAPESPDTPGTIRGNIRDVLTGKPLSAAVSLPTRPDVTVAVGPTGAFEVRLEPGRYPIAITLRGYQTQARDVVVPPGDTVVLNVDLRPRGK